MSNSGRAGAVLQADSYLASEQARPPPPSDSTEPTAVAGFPVRMCYVWTWSAVIHVADDQRPASAARENALQAGTRQTVATSNAGCGEVRDANQKLRRS